jgi:hypothetical protein
MLWVLASISIGKRPCPDRLHERTVYWFEKFIDSVLPEFKSCLAVPTRGRHTLNINKLLIESTSGQDTDGLGRWAWTQYGRNVSLQWLLRIVQFTALELCLESATELYFDGRIDRCPRLLMLP